MVSIDFIRSYVARNAIFFNSRAHSDSQVRMAVQFLLELIHAVDRLSGVMQTIASGCPTITPAQTGNADRDMAHNMRATAIAVLKELEMDLPSIMIHDSEERG